MADSNYACGGTRIKPSPIISRNVTITFISLATKLKNLNTCLS
jgi:hypothetical protein